MRLDVAQWRALLRPGDVVVVVLGLVVCAYAVLSLWQGGAPDGAVVRAGALSCPAAVPLRCAAA